jgi:sec-independent protein translocase protein TatB
MHFTDYTIILVLALILFGPKKLPEIARQIGKLMVEFRRASNEFKAQIEDELRTMEQQDRQKKLESAAAQTPALPLPENTAQAYPAAEEAPQPVILPPSIGEIVSTDRPRMPVAPPELLEAASADPHPVYAEALASETNGTSPHPHPDPDPDPDLGSAPESEQATINHG